MLAQEAEQSLSVGQTLAVAAVPAALALMGVVVTVVVGQWRASKSASDALLEAERSRQHDHAVERKRLLREHRLARYERLVVSSRVALDETVQLRDQPTHPETVASSVAAINEWTAALSEIQLVGDDEVVGYAKHIDQELRTRRRKASTSSRLAEAGLSAFELSDDDRQGLYERNDALHQRLLEACREQVGSSEE